MQDELYDSFDRLLLGLDVPAKIRALGEGGAVDHLWQPLQESGFLDLLVPEDKGGAGLGWKQAWQVMFAAGRHGLPVPLASTIFARGLLANHDLQYPLTPMAIGAFADREENGSILARDVCGVHLASDVLILCDGALFLLPVGAAALQAVGTKGCFDGQARWSAVQLDDRRLGAFESGASNPNVLTLGLALGLAAQIAGAADQVLQLTLAYANDRSQFGKPIAKFQAVQQQIAEMAEYVYAARMASQIGCQSTDWQPEGSAAQVAKAHTSEVASSIASIAHSVHAAIGVTEQYDLQLYTRRLYEWARAAGGANYWARELGADAMAREDLLDFVRQKVF
jgi:acyl-CoA dehydrogenase